MASSLFAGLSNPQPQKQNDLMLKLLQAARSGKAPQEVLPQLAKQYPEVQRALDIIGSNRPEQVTQIIQNMASGNGVNIPYLMHQLGLK